MDYYTIDIWLPGKEARWWQTRARFDDQSEAFYVAGQILNRTRVYEVAHTRKILEEQNEE